MDFRLSEEQRALVDACEAVLSDICTDDYVRSIERSAVGWTAESLRKLSQVGIVGLAIPARYGGGEGGLDSLCLVAEKAGEHLLSGPALSSAVAALAVELLGSEQQRSRFLPGLASGTHTHAIALTEWSGDWGLGSLGLTASMGEDGGFVLDGTKHFVGNGVGADFLQVWGWLPEQSQGAIFLVSTDAPGLTVEPAPEVTGAHRATVRLDRVEVAIEDVMPLEPTAEARIRDVGALLEAAYITGLCQRALDLAVRYATERHQFGQPIGSFQAIQHAAADMIKTLEAMRWLTRRAAWQLATADLDAADVRGAASRAKAFASEESGRLVYSALQVHGAFGFTREASIQLYYRRQKSSSWAWGDAGHHRRQLQRAVSEIGAVKADVQTVSTSPSAYVPNV